MLRGGGGGGGRGDGVGEGEGVGDIVDVVLVVVVVLMGDRGRLFKGGSAGPFLREGDDGVGEAVDEFVVGV